MNEKIDRRTLRKGTTKFKSEFMKKVVAKRWAKTGGKRVNLAPDGEAFLTCYEKWFGSDASPAVDAQSQNFSFKDLAEAHQVVPHSQGIQQSLHCKSLLWPFGSPSKAPDP